jgi:hypothetical protein
MRREKAFKLVAICIALFIALVVGEICLRVFFKTRLTIVQDERSLAYHYDPELGWFPKPNSETTINASRAITAKHNSDGFRDREFVSSTNPAVLFLGDSFVWGYDAEAPERFTDKLQVKHPEWAVYNCGVSGYGNDQEYLLLQKIFDKFKPRVVFLMYCTENDYDENAVSRAYGFYKPYFTSMADGSQLTVHGVPVPRGERVFWAEHKDFPEIYLARLAIKTYFNLISPEEVHLGMRDGRNQNPTAPLLVAINEFVQSKGARLVVGITDTNPKVEGFLQARGIPTVNVATELRYPKFFRHWTPEGHTFVCGKVEQAILPVMQGL